MNKERLVFHLANITANLLPEGKDNASLKKLRYELTGWLLQHPELALENQGDERSIATGRISFR